MNCDPHSHFCITALCDREHIFPLVIEGLQEVKSKQRWNKKENEEV